MTTSTIELMRALGREERDDEGARLRRLIEDDLRATETIHEDGSITTADGITIIPDTVVPPAPRGTRMSAVVHAALGTAPGERLRPMHPHSVPEGVTRSVRLVSLLRQYPADPETYHRFLAADTIVQLRDLVELRGARTLDIGGQAGFMSEALRDEGATCFVAEHPGAPNAPDGRVDRTLRICSEALPFADDSLDLVYCGDVLSHLADPFRLLDEMARVLRPGKGIGYVAFTNRRSPLSRLQPGGRGSPVSIGQLLAWLSCREGLHVLAADSRYWPWASKVVHLPMVREVATGSLRVVFRVRS